MLLSCLCCTLHHISLVADTPGHAVPGKSPLCMRTAQLQTQQAAAAAFLHSLQQLRYSLLTSSTGQHAVGCSKLAATAASELAGSYAAAAGRGTSVVA
jgi:hypothetical protein